MYLLPPILLVFWASGSWAQETELLQTMESETASVTCRYQRNQCQKTKAWCLITSRQSCTILVGSTRIGVQSQQFSIQDHPDQNNFTVTMIALKVRNTGFYHCGIIESSRVITSLRTFHLLVSKAMTPATTPRMSIVLASASSPAIDSPETNWTLKVIIAGVTVVILLLLVLVILVVLYLRNFRGSSKKPENVSHHIYEGFSGQKEATTGFSEQTLSNEDTGGICYASLIHLNPVSPQDTVYSNMEPYPKPSPDPFLSVEYATISRNRLQPSTSSPLEEETGN